MECLVDDTMNSNFLSKCPDCGLDSPVSSTSGDMFARCENCKAAADTAVVNNNQMLQSHRDFVPSPDFTRPRCCSCLEKSSAVQSPRECPEPEVHLDVPLARPRSSSSPNQSASHDQSERNASISTCHNLIAHSKDCTHIHSSQASPDGLLISNIADSVGHDPLSVQSLQHSPDKPGSEIPSDTALSNERCTTSNLQTCPSCGLVSGTNDTGLANVDLQVPSSNVNIQQTASDTSSPGSSNIPGATAPTNASSLSGVVEASNLTASSSVSALSEPLAPRGDPEHQKTHSNFKQNPETKDSLEIPTENTVPTQNSDVPKSGAHLRPLYLTSAQIISHNTELNRIKTAATKRTTKSTRSPRLTHGHFGIGQPSRPTRHSLSSTTVLPMVITPDSPLPRLPSEFLYELHDLDHENEDLSAEVVYSLHFRDYQIKEMLGKGISSTVRRVTEKSTGVEYAVKIIDISGEKGEITQLDQVKKDTYREISILRMCAGHSHIIELHDVFETPTFIFLVFELCRKGELFDYLTSVVSLSEKRTRIFMRQLIEAVAYIHDKNIVHRDLKPENILLDDQLNIKVSDFGFATVIAEGEELTELCGTPGYLAPEVLAHSMYENVSGYGKEVDMWACGVIMYTLLCGAPPFWNRRQMMMLRAIMNADYTFNSPEWDDITEAPKNLIQKLLLVNPKDRLTAKDALKHPFFHSQITEEKLFHARRKFRAVAACIMFYLRMSFFSKQPPPISLDMVRSNPYGIKIMRKIIDTCAFGMYKHWVKRVDNQNRAALFEHTLRDDWKHTPMIIDGIKI
ncbi:unnamed protein product [Candidula unifasciata]|uniref:phosphorylase kinase n=1 Tax=Candidula unifasciata TaxID=100452 RepID=A0A8S3Z797_9EUPU|nr:unnamed protein product [Candidula unifasciata]